MDFKQYMETIEKQPDSMTGCQIKNWILTRVLRRYTIAEAWNSSIFERFPGSFRYTCPDCAGRKQCMGGCSICPEIVLCKDKVE